MSDVKWVKLATDMFSRSRKIKQIEKMPDGDTLLIIWIKLIALAGSINDSGRIYLTPEIPFTDEMLAIELDRPTQTVRLAKTLFQQFQMIEVKDDFITLSNWEKYQSTDKLAEMREQNRQRQARHKAKQKALAEGNVTVTLPVTLGNATEEERDKEKDKESHSFILSDGEESFEGLSTDLSPKERVKRTYMGGTLGQGVVFLSDEQVEDLLEKLSIEEFDHYVSVVANMELSGKRYTKKTHYQAILDMAAKDRAVRKE